MDKGNVKVILVNLGLLVIMGILLIVPNAGNTAKMGRMLPKAVCHAITEDSDITDCSYRNGAWWTK